ncbi:uncharacterized protein LOC132314166 [Cornus florida]|uniref:uncharacterized protein LOC132314166 n=1 Tax=Cornus florida TaxID=4283 RepID=UPI002899366B|nr:uncharacterized protein LOC132314166 [Cornus florida]
MAFRRSVWEACVWMQGMASGRSALYCILGIFLISSEMFWNFLLVSKNTVMPVKLKEKEREFILLKQDTISVTDYEVKFAALSRFAPKFVQNEEDKCTKFQDWLEAAIKFKVSVFEETNYNRLVNKAMIAERDVKELQERREQYKRNRFEPSQSRGGEGISSSFGGRGTGRECFQCGKEGHQKNDCSMLKAEECYHCHQPSHRKRECPMLIGLTSVGSVAGSGRGFAQGNSSRGGKGATSGSQAQGKVFAMTLQDAQATPEVVTCTLSILDRNVTVFIDPGSIHSFVASFVAINLGRPLSLLDSKLFISTPMGEVVVVANEYRDYVLQLGDRQLKVNLIPLSIPDFITFWIPGEPEFRFIGEINVIPNCLISAIQTRKLLKKSCQGYLAYVVNTENKDVTLENVPVVREFTNVFPEELPGLPVGREVDFTIELVLGTTPISIAPYRMALAELKELRIKDIVARFTG